ncbi:MAG: carboxypeptidase-like regulatory domain-containing protein [Candidatus Eremiobacterota bacterium]
MKIFFTFILFFILLLITISGCGDNSTVNLLSPTATEQAGYSLTGYVLDTSEVPIPYAYVLVIYYEGTIRHIIEITADSNGNYTFNNIPVNIVRIEIWENKENYENHRNSPIGAVNITLNPGVNTVNIVAGHIDPPLPDPSGNTPTPTVLPAENTPTPTMTPLTAITPSVSGGTITGTVVDSDGGSPVSNSTVKLSTGQITQTDGSGYFIMTGIEPGTYNLDLLKEGYAISRAQDINILPYKNTNLEMIQKPCFYSGWQRSQPPQISLTGASDGSVINTSTLVTLSATCFDNNIKSILVREGCKHSDTFAFDKSPVYYTLAPERIPPGGSWLYITAYDANNNRTELTIHVITDYSGTTVPAMVTGVNTYAMTYGESLEKYKMKILEKYGKIPDDIFSYPLHLPGEKTMDIKGVPEDATCFVDVSWVQNGAPCYKIYRATSGQGTYSFIGTSYTNSFADRDPSFVYPGQTLYYKISPFNGINEGPLSEPSSTKILDLFHVILTDPEYNSTLSDLTPTFEWTSTSVPGSTKTFTIYVSEYNSPDSPVYKTVIPDVAGNITTHAFTLMSNILNHNRVYEWNINAVATAPGAISVPDVGFLFDSNYPSNNGSFKFVTP